MRGTGALLALAIAAIHVADQGGLTVMNSPLWLGWAFRLAEAGGVLTALAMLLPLPTWLGPGGIFRVSDLRWVAGVLLGAGPFISYVLTRSVGLPGDPGDVGNWGYHGLVSLFAEAALVTLSAGMLLSVRSVRRR